MSSSPFRRAAAGLSLGTFLAALIVVGSPLAAYAHDQVISTSPQSQEILEAAPAEVSMEFSDDILDIGATILVVDNAEKDWASGDMRVEGRTAVQSVAAEIPNGSYQVRWRVVSSDGHPISGTFDFAVGEMSTPAVAPAAENEPAPVATLPAATDSSTGRNDTVAPPLVLIGFGGAVVGAGIFLLVITLVKSRRRRT